MGMMRQYELVDRVKRYNPNTDEELLNRAYVYAMRMHGSQTRASGDPYYAHPIEVAGILTDLHLDDETIATGILHDTIEDTETSEQELVRVFGQDIAAIVEQLGHAREGTRRMAEQAAHVAQLARDNHGATRQLADGMQGLDAMSAQLVDSVAYFRLG